MTAKKYLLFFFAISASLMLLNAVSLVMFMTNPKLFYYRPWEYFPEIGYRAKAYDASWDDIETSDLTRSNLLYYQDPHKTYVTVDKDGFRSNYLSSTDYPVVVSGDSTIFGTGLSDNETFPWRLSELLDIPVFNAGRTSLYNALKRTDVAETDIVIDCVTERNVMGTVFNDYEYEEGSAYTPIQENNKSRFEVLGEIPPQRYLVTSIALRGIERLYNDAKVFMSGGQEKYRVTRHRMGRDDLHSAVTTIRERSDKIEAMGKRYIFVVIPAKQSIYVPGLDEFTGNYITSLNCALAREGIETIDLLGPFRQHAPEGLYHRYDTHWNAEGTRIAAQVVAEHLMNQGEPNIKTQSACDHSHALHQE